MRRSRRRRIKPGRAAALIVALSVAGTACAPAARHNSLVIDIGKQTAPNDEARPLEPGDSVVWSNHDDVIRRVEITGRQIVLVLPGASAVTTFDHAGKWTALDPDLAQVLAVIEVGHKR
jgi:hypothetical protein